MKLLVCVFIMLAITEQFACTEHVARRRETEEAGYHPAHAATPVEN